MPGISEDYSAKLDELTAWTQQMELRHRAYRDAVASHAGPSLLEEAKLAYEQAKDAVDEATADVWEMIESGEAMAEDQAST